MKNIFYCLVIFTVLFISCSKATEDLNKTIPVSAIILGNNPSEVNYTFINHLYGFKAVPTNSSLGHAKLVVKFDGINIITYSIQCDGFVPSEAHIHSGISIENGPVEVDLGSVSALPFEGTARLNDAQVNNLLGGKLYLDIHSAIFPDGEVRTQIGK
ncbi:MAG TPA: CHRD domain-containing protein [Ferruginibacter sp.]|nr:CHRD domain-containing protein [Ferruginibacter sp.]